MTSPEDRRPNEGLPRLIDSLDQAGNLGQLWQDIANGRSPMARLIDPPGLGAKPRRVALRGFYFSPDGMIEWGTLFFGKRHDLNPRSIARRTESLDRSHRVIQVRKFLEEGGERSSYLDIPERRALVGEVVSVAPSRVVSTIEVTEDLKTGKYTTHLAFSAHLFDPRILHAIRDSALRHPEVFDETGLSEDTRLGLMTMDPKEAQGVAELYALTSIAKAERHAGDFFYPGFVD